MCFGTTIPDLVDCFRSLSAEDPPPGTLQAPQRGPGLRDWGRRGLAVSHRHRPARIVGDTEMDKSEEHVRLRFQAVVIASQLPDNTAEALLVLDYARHMVVQSVDETSGVSVTDNVQLSFLHQ